MTGAVQRVWERSRAKGTARILLMALAESSAGCIVRGAIGEFARRAGISERQAYRDVEILRNLREIESRVERIDKKKVTRFHLLPLHPDKVYSVNRPPCSLFDAILPDLRTQILLCEPPRISTMPERTATGLLKGRDLEEHEWRMDQLRRQLNLPVKGGKVEFQLEP